MEVAIVGTNCYVSATLLQFLILNPLLVAYGAARNVGAWLHGVFNDWLQLQRCYNVAATSYCRLNFWLQKVQFAKLLQCCMEVATVVCIWNVAATSNFQSNFLVSCWAACNDAAWSHGGFESWLQLQRCSNVAATLYCQHDIWLHTVQIATLPQHCRNAERLVP